MLGAVLTPGKRTVTAALSVMGLCQNQQCQNYPRVLNRAVVEQVFAPHGPILLGLDDTVERRRGKKITAKGIYRAPFVPVIVILS